MNKKGVEEETLESAGSLLITAIIIIALFGIIYLLISSFKLQDENKEFPVFYYESLVKQVQELKDNTKILTTLSSNSDYIFLGFSKGLNEININDLKDSCGKANLAQNAPKPLTCKGNSCLCICEVDSDYLGIGSGLLVDCNGDHAKCVEFNDDIVGGDSCNYLLYYDTTKKPKDFEINKNLGKVIINPK